MVAIVAADKAAAALKFIKAQQHKAWIIGEVVKGKGEARVVWFLECGGRAPAATPLSDAVAGSFAGRLPVKKSGVALRFPPQSKR